MFTTSSRLGVALEAEHKVASETHAWPRTYLHNWLSSPNEGINQSALYPPFYARAAPAA